MRWLQDMKQSTRTGSAPISRHRIDIPHQTRLYFCAFQTRSRCPGLKGTFPSSMRIVADRYHPKPQSFRPNIEQPRGIIALHFREHQEQ